jgi:Holliday junction resolvase-like predicted endonuclease
MDTKHVGARSELLACAWLLAEGYEVFRNVSSHGHVDIIALKDGKTFYFDVKTLKVGGKSYCRLQWGAILRRVQNK